MTRAFSMGVSLTEFVPNVANGLTELQLLAAVDTFKNSLADQLGLAHGAASAYLYPASVSIWLRLYGDNRSAPFGQSFPGIVLMDGLRDRGITPMLFVEPAGTVANCGTGYNVWANWSAGAFDDWLDAFAAAAKGWGSPIIFRLAQEQNGTWFDWSVGKAGNTSASFKAAWAYIHERLHGAAPNVQMLYSPSAGGGITEQFPGDTYCEYVGFTAYTWGATPSMRAIYRPATDELAHISTRPIIVTETGVNAGTDTHRSHWVDGGGWSNGGYRYVVNKMSRIRGVVYFDVDVTRPELGGGGPNWRLEKAGPITLRAYAKAALLSNGFSSVVALHPMPVVIL